MPTRPSKHKQGMAKEREPKPAAAIATGIEGPRMDYEHGVHNADRGNAMKATPHRLSIGHQRGSRQRRRKCGRRQRTREEQEAANTEERYMSGMREYLNTHTNHKPEGTKRASGMPTHASMHEQGMAREREPEPAAANTTGKEGPRRDKENDINNAATPAHPPTGKPPRNPPSSLSL